MIETHRLKHVIIFIETNRFKNYANRMLVSNDFNFDGKIQQKPVTNLSQFNDKSLFETFKSEQKLLEIHDFKKVEKEVNEKMDKKKKRRETAGKKKNSLKRKKKLDEEKIEKKELCGKLNELNKEFQTINITKKKRKKCLRQY